MNLRKMSTRGEEKIPPVKSVYIFTTDKSLVENERYLVHTKNHFVILVSELAGKTLLGRY
jgi:hypothetical protein